MNQSIKKLALHWQIFIGIVLGLLLGIVALQFAWGPEFVRDWIKPFGIVFIKLLKLIAVPLVFTSLAKGISDLKDLASLSRMGGKTVFWYLLTTVFAVMLGLLLVNLFKPGLAVDATSLQQMAEYNTATIDQKIQNSDGRGPLSFFVDVIPDNIFFSLGQNGSLLQVIFFTIFFSICLLLIPADQSKVTKDLIDSLNHIMLKMVDIIILISPYAVVALIAALITETANPDLFKALMSYASVLLFGMFILLCLYPLLVKFLTGMPLSKYLRGILPAQLVAFTTSSSMATLPVTMECVEDNLDVESEVASFVCPIGATINMDATSLMQAIAAVFVCQMLGHDLGINDQITIVATATLASIGAAAAPSAGIIMLVIVLESVGFPSESLPIALAMILAIDRPLDMCRTIVNVSGDAFVSILVNHRLKKEL